MNAPLSDSDITASILERLASELLVEARRLRAKQKKRKDGGKQLKATIEMAKALTSTGRKRGEGLGRARLGGARHGMARNKARQGEARQGQDRQGTRKQKKQREK